MDLSSSFFFPSHSTPMPPSTPRYPISSLAPTVPSSPATPLTIYILAPFDPVLDRQNIRLPYIPAMSMPVYIKLQDIK